MSVKDLLVILAQATIFVGKNTIQEQINHLAGELEELKKADSWEEKAKNHNRREAEKNV
jgi:hypothetical protein